MVRKAATISAQVSASVLAVTLLLLACSNQVKLTSRESGGNFTFKSFQDAIVKNDFKENTELTQGLKDKLKGELKLFSHLDQDRVLFATNQGQSVIANTKNNSTTAVSISLPGNIKADWIYAFGANDFWAAGNGRFYYSGSGASDNTVIEDSLENVFESADIKLRPIAVSQSDFVGVSGNRLVWLSVAPNLRRELFLNLDSAVLGNFTADSIASGGVIKGRGLWLQLPGTIVYVLKDSAEKFYPERVKMPDVTAQKNKVSVARVSGVFASNENSVIAPENGLVVLSEGNKIYLSAAVQTGGAQGSDGDGGVGLPTPTPVASASPTPTQTPSGPSLMDLRNQYDTRFKALFDSRCVACHANRTSRWNTFDNVKLFASQGASRVDSADMPRGSTLSATDKADAFRYLSELARLP